MVASQHEQLLRSVAERTLRFRFGTWYWGDAIAIDGLLEAGQVVGGSYREDVVSCLDHWARFAPTSFDDALVPGRTVLQLRRRVRCPGRQLTGSSPPWNGSRC